MARERREKGTKDDCLGAGMSGKGWWRGEGKSCGRKCMRGKDIERNIGVRTQILI